MKKQFSVILTLIFALVLAVSPALADAGTTLGDLYIDVGDPWANIDTDVTVTSTANNFLDGYVEFAVTGGVATDNFQLVNGGSLTIVGNGVFYNGNRIGSIDNTYNGSNGRLRINFSGSAPLTNSSFETDDMTGWTVNSTNNQLNGESWAVTPTGFAACSTLPSDDKNPTIDGGTSITDSAATSITEAHSGTYSLRMYINGSVALGCDSSHSPSVISSTFTATATDSVSLWYWSRYVSDASDVYGFVTNSSGGRQFLFHDTVTSRVGVWKNASVAIGTTVCPTGSCSDLKFEFMNGTFDSTGGRAVGSTMYIDDIVLTLGTPPTAVTNLMVEAIIENTQYRNTSSTPVTPKAYNINFMDAASVPSSSAANIFIQRPPIAVDDAVSTDEDTSFTTIDLVADNDTDPNGDTLGVTGINTTGTTGQVTDNRNGTFDYDPNGQFESLSVGDSDTDTFAYTISDGNGGIDSATVTVTINGTNDVVVMGNSLAITDGDTTPSSADDTDFGSTALFLGTVEHTYTIENQGNIDLNLTGAPLISVGGAHPADFSVTSQPSSPMISGHASTTFSVTFDPSVAGSRTAEISIASDDSVTPYTFAIQGTGVENDTDIDGVIDNVEGGGDRDGDGVQNYLDYDPTGYFYDEATGAIISGGLVSASGPGAITTFETGASGFYQFATDGTAGVYTMVVTLPPGYNWSTTCLQGDPPAYDPTGQPDPDMLGAGENGTTGFLTSNACATFYFTMDLASGDPFIINNNFPLAARPLPPTGFAPGQVTELAVQTGEKSYQKLGGMWLEVPSLGMQANLVGVPSVNGEWDVTWLGNNAGYLSGTAFPTWTGNTVITGHVWNADN
ncbi:MAG: choice-of-anchor D domain-containing protein [Candidatus Electryonea clarkiae]|nr:choice-of-anchor D domain-containing protein [Candidatus Electryonea clarkiae]